MKVIPGPPSPITGALGGLDATRQAEYLGPHQIYDHSNTVHVTNLFFLLLFVKKKCRLYNNINNLIECTSFVCCLFVTVKKKKNGHLTLLHIKRAVSYEIIFQGV